jgi:hypothetical protein
MARVNLTKKESSTEVGIKLIKALETILADGQVTEREVLQLKDWLSRAMKRDDFPALRFLAEEVEAVIADGKITQEETWQLAEAALRVLPPDVRKDYKGRVNEIRANMPTDKQLKFIKDLGGSLPPNASKMDASELIDELLETRPSFRQRMVIKFWGRNDLISAGSDGVSRWMDKFYGQDPDRQEAWELWKRETPNSQSREGSIIDQIELGMGERYLARIKESKKSNPAAVMLRTLAYSLLAILFVVAIIVIVFKW